MDLIHDARHPYTLLRIDGIEAMSRGFSGGKQGIILSNTTNRHRVGLFLTTENEPLPIAGLHVTSRRPCWWSRTKAFLSSGN